MKDFKFVRYLTKEKVSEIKYEFAQRFFFDFFKQLATIPVTGFYTASHRHFAENYIRFCFAKVSEIFTSYRLIIRFVYSLSLSFRKMRHLKKPLLFFEN